MAATKLKKTFTIGLINYVSIHAPVIEGFKTSMTELGYVEGENVIYIDNDAVAPDPQIVDAENKQLLSQNIDLLFPVGNLRILRAKHAVEDTDMPVVFGAVANPIEDGIVESISRPVGNLTGVQVEGNDIPKALEWLVSIIPEARKVYVPYNPEDKASVANLTRLDNVLSQLGIELVYGKVSSAEEAVAAIESLSDDIDAIFRILRRHWISKCRIWIVFRYARS